MLGHRMEQSYLMTLEDHHAMNCLPKVPQPKGWVLPTGKDQHSTCTETEFLDEIQSKVVSLLFTVTCTALPWDFYFFKLTQPLTVSRVQFLCTVKKKGRKPDRKPDPLPYGLINSYRNLKSKNSQDYAQKSQRNSTFMNSASVQTIVKIKICAKNNYPALSNRKLVKVT